MGVINSLFILPYTLSTSELGLFRFLIQSSFLLFPLVCFGSHSISVKFYPIFKDKSGKDGGLLIFSLYWGLLSYSIIVAMVLLLFDEINLFFESKNDLLGAYWFYVIPLSGFLIFTNTFFEYSKNFKSLFFPTIFEELYLKITLPLFSALYFFNILLIGQAVLGFVLSFLLSLISYLIFFRYKKIWNHHIDRKVFTSERLKQICQYTIYSMLGKFGSIFAYRIDIIMISVLAANTLSSTGIYSVALLIASIIAIPSRAINNIAAPVISQAWEDKDLEKIEDIYNKSSLNLLAVGLFLLLLIWSNVDEIFNIMPNGHDYKVGKMAILLLATAQLVQIGTGLTKIIIEYSQLYRFNFYAIIIMAFINFITNYHLIPVYGIIGAASATLLAFCIFNFFQVLFIYSKFKIQPFTYRTVLLLIISIIVGLLVSFLSIDFVAPINMILKGSLITFLFWTPLFYFDLCPDLREVCLSLIAKLRSL